MINSNFLESILSLNRNSKRTIAIIMIYVCVSMYLVGIHN